MDRSVSVPGSDHLRSFPLLDLTPPITHHRIVKPSIRESTKSGPFRILVPPRRAWTNATGAFMFRSQWLKRRTDVSMVGNIIDKKKNRIFMCVCVNCKFHLKKIIISLLIFHAICDGNYSLVGDHLFVVY